METSKLTRSSNILPGRILVVDDEEQILQVWKAALTRKKHQVFLFDNPLEALSFLQREEVDLVILDYMMPGMNGLELLEQIKEQFPDTEAIMMTGYASVDTALSAMKLGAYDYLQKPFEQIGVAVRVVEKALERKQLVDRNQELEQQLLQVEQEQYEGMVGSSPPMQNVFKLIEQVSGFDVSVLIRGETGTGKEQVARAIHHKSARKNRAFIPVVCSSIPENLLESTLFGHRKGSFTGAIKDKKGLIEEADGGTLFLDELGDIPLSMQVKLLRVLQEGEIQRVGDSAPTLVDVRFIAATHRNLKEAIKKGTFREDLYYRLNLIEMELPPLRDRGEDIDELCFHFLRTYGQRFGKEIKHISASTLALLRIYSWPGNVRELENVIARSLILEAGEELGVHALPEKIRGSKAIAASIASQPSLPSLPAPSFIVTTELSFKEAKKIAVTQFETHYLKNLLEETNGNISRASVRAGMDRANFRRLLKKHSLIPDKTLKNHF